MIQLSDVKKMRVIALMESGDIICQDLGNRKIETVLKIFSIGWSEKILDFVIVPVWYEKFFVSLFCGKIKKHFGNL